MISIDDKYAEALINEIRDKETNSDILKDRLYLLGQKMGQAVSGDLLTENKTVTTPMGYSHAGLHLSNKRIVVISTKDDYEYFAKGFSSTMRDVVRGFMDFEGVRGTQALSHPIRSILLPEIKDGQGVNCVIVAKSVLATGCTAISLTKKAIELYNPRNVVIATVFYTEYGISEILSEIANAQIYAFGKPEQMDDDGMLTPGFGDLDTRLNA